ncbi:DNA repair protein rad13 [Rhypophila decipiens]|uniref:DNA repair protein rad13 n=1 Tax=Rhypophila decipiens TaxID=261697 RepID=A0AAN6YCE1_9PEZI|nr:DNA repair protein rad13 [Rhypophila decipiens]
MGVNGLWTVVQPTARPTNLATLNRKRLAVDASIWIYQFLKAVRDKEGNALRNSHVVGFFRRICKLLWFGIKPVFVFDGGAPALKRATLQGRRQRREGRREDAVRTAGKLLAVQMHRLAEEEEEKRKRQVYASETVGAREEEEQEVIPDAQHIVYADELGMSQQERQKNRSFKRTDAYHLPDLQNGIEAMGKPDDPRIMSVEELEEYARQFNDGEDINLYDFSKIDFDGDFFKSLPPADRYNILNAARLRSRLRMGLSKDQLDEMFPDRMAFSRFQIERVKERNHLTQRLMYEMGMGGTDLTLAVNARVAGERNREYILVKNEGAEGGWALGVVSRDKDRGAIHKPIDVDALEFQYQTADTDSDEDMEFEDVPIEGVNRLPKLSRFTEASTAVEESLFVDNDDDEDLFGDDDGDILDDEQEDLDRAIAMSLQNQHGGDAKETEAEDLEDTPRPAWAQKAVEAPKPIARASGRMVAHIVNNRSNAAVPKRRESNASSDSEVDMRTALAAARKKQKPAPKPAPKPATKAQDSIRTGKSTSQNPFGGPLPFEKLDWRNIFSSSSPFKAAGEKEKQTERPKELNQVETGDFEAEMDDDAGGFEREPEEPQRDEAPVQPRDDAPRPLPPWLADTTDIRESVKRQKEYSSKMNAEDDMFRRQEELLFQKRKQESIIHIESDDDSDGDVEILDAPPPPPPLPQQAFKVTASQPTIATSSTPVVSQPLDMTEPNTTAEQTSQNTAIGLPDEEDEAEEDVFEDVAVPDLPAQPSTQQATEEELEDARLDAMLFGDGTGAGAEPGATGEEDLFAGIEPPAPEEFDEFSDPEDEELLAQMAEEVEEHARFASELNNKTQEENREAFERELKALRTQQKKDRRDADEVTQVMVAECQSLLRLFGIPYITAPMEAEAQCAELVRLNLVDGIVTDDSDTFLFGGTRVYKNMFNSNKFVECYLAGDIEKELSLSREQLISLAQLLGSDYTEGLQGVGPVTAVEILSEFPSKDGLVAFKEWWTEVQTKGRPKEADASSPFRRKFRKSQATKLFLPVGFPSPAVFDAYMAPEVDSDPQQFQWGIPDLEGLRQFLTSTIGWGQERTDEVLVPVIRDMNRREAEGTQSNITRYFSGSVGTGAVKEAFAPRQRGAKGSKRMAEAVSKLRAKTGGGGGGGGLSMEMPVLAFQDEQAGGSKRKRKARVSLVVEDDEDEVNEDAGSQEESAGARGKRKGKGRATGKRTKAL